MLEAGRAMPQDRATAAPQAPGDKKQCLCDALLSRLPRCWQSFYYQEAEHTSKVTLCWHVGIIDALGGATFFECPVVLHVHGACVGASASRCGALGAWTAPSPCLGIVQHKGDMPEKGE